MVVLMSVKVHTFKLMIPSCSVRMNMNFGYGECVCGVEMIKRGQNEMVVLLSVKVHTFKLMIPSCSVRMNMNFGYGECVCGDR